MWTISICMNFPKYSIYLPSLMKQISQGHHGWRYAIAAKETEIDGVEEFLSEGITCSNTHTSSRIDWLQHEWESASRPSFFAPISYRTSMLYAMLKMTLLWIFRRLQWSYKIIIIQWWCIVACCLAYSSSSSLFFALWCNSILLLVLKVCKERLRD